MKNSWLFLLIACCTCLYINPLVAQRPLNNINVNFLGNSPVVSMNYERIFPVNNCFMIATQIGVGYFPPIYQSKPLVTTPYLVSGNLGKGVYFFEFGLAGAIGYRNGELLNGRVISPMVGYRYQPIKRRSANFRIYSTYSKDISIKESYLWLGFSTLCIKLL